LFVILPSTTAESPPRGETLTRQLLAFSRRQPLNPVVAELSQRIDALRTLLANSLGASIQLKTSIALDTWSAENVENGNNRLAPRLIVGRDAVQV